MNNLVEHPLISTQNLIKNYKDGKTTTQVLKGITFSLLAKSMTAIIGSSGSGKSTLLHLLGGLDSPTSGEIKINQTVLNSLNENQKAELRNQQIGFIYQFHHLLSDFNALENIAMPLLISGKNSKKAKEKAQEMLDFVNLSHRAKHRPSELSGGERQRVAIARALINNPSIVMADEPTGNLDQENAAIIFDLLTDINKQYGTAFLIVTHDKLLANKMRHQYLMNQGVLTKLGENQ